MKLRALSLLFVSITLLSLLSRGAWADIRLPALLSENMVLQQKTPIRIWGWADDGENVTVSFQGQSITTTTNGGYWWVNLKPLRAGGPYTLVLTGKNTIVFQNILVGDVWICSGQSNMEFPVRSAANGRSAIAQADDPELRMFTVRRNVAVDPQKDVPGSSWERASPETVGHFSAVGYFFGLALRRSHHVPIGLIHASWGGTRAEAWTSGGALEAWGMAADEMERTKQTYAEYRKILDDYHRHLAAWQADGSPDGPFDDPGNTGLYKGWAAPHIETADWQTITLPTYWQKSDPELNVQGGLWFRKEIDLPDSWLHRDLALNLGPISNFDHTYVDGIRVGGVGPDSASAETINRRYIIPYRILMRGKNVIAVRVWNRTGPGGFAGPAEAMTLAPMDTSGLTGPDAEPITLNGAWQYRLEVCRNLKPTPPKDFDNNAASVLYNGMIAPLTDYAIKGAIWYQGEANTADPEKYRTLLPALIRDWRRQWNEGDFPFLLVQLAPYKAISPTPQESNWAALREAQTLAAKQLPDVGMAVIPDVGDEKDIHPKEKQVVGERLALLARKIAYGEKVVASGPTLKSIQIAYDKIVVHYENIGKGLEVRGNALTGFAIAGADGRFVRAEAVLQKDHVVLSSPEVPSPVAVRYGWADYPEINLWNRDGLPACPFRTDGPASK